MREGQPAIPSFLGDADFIEREVLPVLNGRAKGGEASSCRFRLADTQEATRVTAEYTLADGTSFFAKVYAGDKEDGAHCYEVMRTLQGHGFGNASYYRIAEPLAYLPQRRVLITRGVPGVCLADILGTGSAEQFRGVREAARWLARLHRVPVQVGRPWQVWRNFHYLAHRMTKATARRPELAKDLLVMLDRLAELGASAEQVPRLVQTHGQFRDVHVFVTDKAVSLIDFDRSLPADPAKDLDEFLHRLRWKTFKHTRRQADDLTAAFLNEYTTAAPVANLMNLPFYWAYHALYSLARFVRSAGPEQPDWNEVIAFFTGEFETAVSGRLGAVVRRSA